MPSVSTIEEPSHIRNDTTNEPSTDATEPAQPVVHSAETLTDLKSRRTCERDRKLARKRLIRNAKLNAQAPWAYSLARPAQDPLRDEYGNIRSARQHMTMHVKGGWHVQLDDDAAAPAESPGEDERNALGEGGDRTMRIEVPLAEVLKPGKPRRRAGSGTCCEGVPTESALTVR